MFDLNFPIVKNVSAKSIAEDIQPMKSMTLEEAAKGRPIRPYPKRYDDFEDNTTLLEYLQIKMKELGYPLDWLDVSLISSLPLNLSEDVYYIGVNSVAITAYEPVDNPFQDIRNGGTILELNPENWSVKSLQKRINQLKDESR